MWTCRSRRIVPSPPIVVPSLFPPTGSLPRLTVRVLGLFPFVTLPSNPCLCLSPMESAQSSPPAGRPPPQQHGVPDQVFNPDPLLGSVLRCQYLLQRREGGACFFHLWDITHVVAQILRGLADACSFYPRVQLEELRVVGASSENSYCLCLLLIWNSQFSILILVHEKKTSCRKTRCVGVFCLCLDGLLPCRCETCLRYAFLSRCRSLLVRTECNTSPSPGPSRSTPVVSVSSCCFSFSSSLLHSWDVVW